jgi:hypothetical protein
MYICIITQKVSFYELIFFQILILMDPWFQDISENWNQEGTPTLGVVVHTCNHNYSRGGDQEDHGLRSAQAKKKLLRPQLNQ